MAISFTKNGAREHREGLVVRFYPAASEPWVGNFIGGETACNIVINHPNMAYVIVVAQGEACIVDPERRAILDSMAWDTDQVFPIPSLGLVIFQRLTDFIAIGADNADGLAHAFPGMVFVTSRCTKRTSLAKHTLQSATPGCRSDSTF